MPYGVGFDVYEPFTLVAGSSSSLHAKTPHQHLLSTRKELQRNVLVRLVRILVARRPLVRRAVRVCRLPPAVRSGVLTLPIRIVRPRRIGERVGVRGVVLLAWCARGGVGLG